MQSYNKAEILSELKRIKEDETQLLLYLDLLPPEEFKEATKALDTIYERQAFLMEKLNQFNLP